MQTEKTNLSKEDYQRIVEEEVKPVARINFLALEAEIPLALARALYTQGITSMGHFTERMARAHITGILIELQAYTTPWLGMCELLSIEKTKMKSALKLAWKQAAESTLPTVFKAKGEEEIQNRIREACEIYNKYVDGA